MIIEGHVIALNKKLNENLENSLHNSEGVIMLNLNIVNNYVKENSSG